MLLLLNRVTALHWNLARWKVETMNLLENITSIPFEYAVLGFHVNMVSIVIFLLLC